MTNKTYNFRISLFSVILIVNLLLCTLSLILYWREVDDVLKGVYGGAACAFFIYLCQHLASWRKYHEIHKIKSLGVIQIIPTRDDEALYRDVINRAERSIVLMGNTAIRFFQDFADPDRTDRQALINALDRNVEVRILLPKHKHLKDDEERDQAKISHRRMQDLAEKYNRFVFRYYDRAPSHNLMMADTECLVGPIFPNIRSKDSPAIHTRKESIYVGQYLTFYESQWGQADEKP